MRRLGSVIIGVMLAGAAQAQDWHALDCAGIARALTDRSITYDTGAEQYFYASDRTLHTHAEPFWGSWRVEDDQCCSLWPPAPDWDCYDVQTNGVNGVNYLDEGGNSFPGVVAPE